ncbi:MAG: serine protease [Limisphaerales bacterium]
MITTYHFERQRRHTAQIFWLAFAVLCANVSYAQQPSTATNFQPSDLPTMKADTPDQQLFFCTTRIEAKSADGKTSNTGTGFIFNYKIDEQHQIPFIVTCRHVVNGFTSSTFSFVQSKDGKPDLGKKCVVTVPNLQNLVFYDPNPNIDVALILLVPILDYFKANGQTPFFRSLSKDLVPSREAAEDLSAIQSIVFVGYPYGLHDETNSLPIARRGFTANPYVVDFNGLPLFLIDASVFPGSSGSPVMVLDEGAYTSHGGIMVGGRAYFLGLVSDAYIHAEEGVIQFKPLPTQFVPVYKKDQFFNLGVVIKAKAILNTMSEFVKAYPPPSPASTSSPR